MAKPYAEAAETLKKEGSAIKLADVNCEKNNEICTRFQIPGFPTLKLFKNGTPYKDYEDGRTASDIVSFLKRKTGPVATPLKSGEVADFVKKFPENSVIVGYFKDLQSDAAKAFESVAGSLDDFVFAISQSTEDKVVVHRYFNKELLSTTEFSEEKLSAFIKGNAFPLIDEVSGKSFKRYVDAGLPIAVLFLKYDEDKQKNIDVLNKAAESLKGVISFGYSNADEYGAQLEMMGGDSKKLPAIAAMNIEKRTNYPYNGEWNAESIQKWAAGIADGSIKPFLKSQPIPEDNSEPVKVVVGKNFDEIVNDSTKDVLVEFYAPWCGHCKKLAPIYEKLAESLSSVDSLVIAKVDATENDIEGIPIEGFPTVLLFPSDNKETPIPYEGERTVPGFKKFLKENAVASKDKLIEALKSKKEEAQETEVKDEL